MTGSAGALWRRTAALLVGASLVSPAPEAAAQDPASSTPAVAGQACSEGPISRIDVETAPVFDTGPGAGVLSVYYRVINALHVTTRPAFVRQEALFREGDCLDPFLLSETERRLRELEFIATASVTSSPAPGDGNAVRIATRDANSLKLSLGIAVDDGFTFENLGLSELNFLGRGITVGLFRRERRESLELGVEAGTPRLGGLPLDLRVSGGTTRDGTFGRQSLMLPLVGDRTLGFRQSIDWTLQPFAYAASPDAGYSHVLLPVQSLKAGLAGAYRIAGARAGWWLGGGLAWESVKHPDFPGSVETVTDADFKNPDPAPTEVADLVRGQAEEGAATRVQLLVGRRTIAYRNRTRLEAVNGVDDVRMGTDLVVTVAPSVPFLEGDAPRTDDLYGRVELFAGGAFDRFVYAAAASVEGRRLRDEPTDGRRWQDVLTELDGALYWQPAYTPDDPGRHTLVARARYLGAAESVRPFQLTLGGREGVRGYSRDSFPGGRGLFLTLEERFYVGWPRMQLFDVGAAAFLDVGRMWPGNGNVPFGADSGWKGSIGVGLRLGAPAGGTAITRLELTLPLASDPGPDATYFRVYVDLGGVLRRIRSPQMDRSRYSGVSSDLFHRPRRVS